MKKEIAAIYCRLSVEDAEKRAAESESIRNQRALLLGYAKKQGWAVYDIYADEDYSGLREDRPAFQRLLADAEEKDALNNMLLQPGLSVWLRDILRKIRKTVF